jgi:hypothetical protein
MAGRYSRGERVAAGRTVCAADCSGYIDAQRYGVCLVLPVLRSGAVPVTWLQVLLEIQRDGARSETYALPRPQARTVADLAEPRVRRPRCAGGWLTRLALHRVSAEGKA